MNFWLSIIVYNFISKNVRVIPTIDSQLQFNYKLEASITFIVHNSLNVKEHEKYYLLLYNTVRR